MLLLASVSERRGCFHFLKLAPVMGGYARRKPRRGSSFGNRDASHNGRSVDPWLRSRGFVECQRLAVRPAPPRLRINASASTQSGPRGAAAQPGQPIDSHFAGTPARPGRTAGVFNSFTHHAALFPGGLAPTPPLSSTLTKQRSSVERRLDLGVFVMIMLEHCAPHARC